MGASRKKFDGTFKHEAVRLADSSGKRDRTIERELGLYQGALRHWRKELKADPGHAFPGTGHLKPLEAENLRLRRELVIAQEERDILKKAVAIFSKKPKTSTDL
ncbi:MAG: transposase [Chitinivibrionales bacterium]